MNNRNDRPDNHVRHQTEAPRVSSFIIEHTELLSFPEFPSIMRSGKKTLSPLKFVTLQFALCRRCCELSGPDLPL